MGFVKDLTRSKRPIRQDTERDLPQWQKDADDLERRIDDVERMISAKESSPEYHRVLEDSKRRLTQIAIRAMAVDARQTYELAEIRGQFNERLLLTRELLEEKKELVKEKNRLSLLRDKIQKWLEKKGTGK